MLEDEAEKICSDIAEQMGWDDEYYQISAFQKFGTQEICQDLMEFLEQLPPEQASEDEEQVFDWGESASSSTNEHSDADPKQDDDDEDDHPNVVYTYE